MSFVICEKCIFVFLKQKIKIMLIVFVNKKIRQKSNKMKDIIVDIIVYTKEGVCNILFLL